MNIPNLYPVNKKDLRVLNTLLTECFKNDPLYTELIPDATMRNRLLPELFECDLEEFFETCEIYADSADLNGMIIVSDQSKSYHLFRNFLEDVHAYIKTNRYLIKEDPSLGTLWNFIKGKDYLNSKWTEEIHSHNRLHIIYLAVKPSMQHHRISSKLIGEVLNYAKAHHLMVSLETHNKNNVSLYKHFGFELFEIVKSGFDLKQYCLIHPVALLNT